MPRQIEKGYTKTPLLLLPWLEDFVLIETPTHIGGMGRTLFLSPPTEEKDRTKEYH